MTLCGVTEAMSQTIHKSPAAFGEVAPSVSLCPGDGELRFKLFVDGLVVEDNGVGILVWLASGFGEKMDGGGHPAGHHPVAGGAPRSCGDRDRSPTGRHGAPNMVDGRLNRIDVRTLEKPGWAGRWSDSRRARVA